MERRRSPPLWVERLVRILRRENLHRIFIFLFVLSLLSAVALWQLEPQTAFADWLWWSVVTVTTVGYGDFTPVTIAGRLIGTVLMFFGIGVLSMFTATIAGFFVEIQLKRERGMDQVQLRDHFILCEWNQRAEAVYSELRSDPRTVESPIVVLAGIDAKPVDDDKLFLIHGEVTEENLERANIEDAATVIILGNDELEPGARDARVVLSTLTVEGMNPDAYTVVELVREENRRHCQRAHADEIIVGNEFSSRLIASAAVDHGISKVFSELLSVTYGNDFKQVPVPSALSGQGFLEVLIEMKRTDGSIVLAVQRGMEVTTNPPPEYRVEATDRLIVVTG